MRPGGALTVTELRLLAEMTDAGVRLDRALASLERAGENVVRRRTFAELRAAVESGRTFTEAIVEVKVSPYVRALIAGGERIGCLGDGLRAGADLTSRLDAVRRRVRQAMAYPLVVLVVAVLVLILVSVSVVPQMEQTFADLGGELPRATRIVVAVAAVVRAPLTWAMGGALAAAAWASMGGHLGRARLAAGLSPSGPRSGPFRRPMDTAVAARVIATLLSNGATPVDAFTTAGRSAIHPGVRSHLLELAEIASSGHPVSQTASAVWLLDAVEREMLAVGEERGLLAQQWERVADRRIADLERRLDLLGTLAEPVLVIVVGLIVGGTVTALYLPSIKVLELI
jgi:type IV pilus assembly protein PilC